MFPALVRQLLFSVIYEIGGAFLGSGTSLAKAQKTVTVAAAATTMEANSKAGDKRLQQ